METFSVKDPRICANMLEEAFAKEKSEDVERGLVLAYELFVAYFLEGHLDYLAALSRDLNAVYFPYRFYADDKSNLKASYLGQIRTLINLSDYISRQSVPDRIWQLVSKTKYGNIILRILSKEGAVQAKELCDAAGIPHTSQLPRIVNHLVDQGVMRRQEVGKNVWYSLSAIGRIVAARHYRIEESNEIESILPTIIRKLEVGQQDVTDLVDIIDQNVPLPTRHSLLRSILSALSAAGIVEEHDGSWRLSARIQAAGNGSNYAVDTKHPVLDSAAALIKAQYDQFEICGIPNESELAKASKLLRRVEEEITSGSEKRLALVLRTKLERAKLATFNSKWRDAISVMNETVVTAKRYSVDPRFIDQELDTVWSYVEVICIRPVLWKAKQMLRRADYRGVANQLVSVDQICREANRPITMVNAVSEILDIAAKGSIAASNIREMFTLGLESKVEFRIEAGAYDAVEKATLTPPTNIFREYLAPR